MTTIVTLKSGAYAIYNDEGVKIIQCNNPINTFNEVVKNIGIDATNVQIVDAESFPDALDTTSVSEAATEGLDSVIDKVNATMNHDSEMEMYEDMGILDGKTDDEAFEEAGIDADMTPSAKAPVGSVETPNIGDLVYVEGIRGVLRVITGGVGTVAMIEHDNNLIELEEIPGQYFSWGELRFEQDELKDKYGYKPASMV